MPRTTKEAKSKLEESKKAVKNTSKTKAKETGKKTTTKSATTKKSTSPKATATKKTTTRKTTTSRTNTKRKASTAARTIKKESVTSLKKVKTATPEDFSVLEYYDLPNEYNKTTVKLLAQTPTTLFVYWNISDEDKKTYIKDYGENFFEITKPVLIIYNDTMNYSFEIEINDFANCWYLNVNDSKCKYRIELGRRPINNGTIQNNSIKFNTNYIYIGASNQIESPNDHILFDKNQKTVYFKNVKTNNISSKSINFSYIRKIGKIYNIYDMYKKFYKNEIIENFDLSNPSSSNPSSTFK